MPPTPSSTPRYSHIQVPNRARLARLDVLHGRQAANTRRTAESWTASMGAARAETESDRQPRRVQALLYREAQVRRLDPGGKGKELADVLWGPMRLEGNCCIYLSTRKALGIAK